VGGIRFIVQGQRATMSVKWRIGTSGWNYRHWREIFYPPQVPISKWLDFYTEHFETVEVNATFYRLPKPETFEKWYQNTPPDFVWAVKANKYITHIKRLKDCREPLGRLYVSAERLKEKLGPILFQLPPSLAFDRGLFIAFCQNLDKSYQHTLEIRHPSWIDTHALEILKDHNIAFCISDTAGRYPFHEAVTADFVYVRLHGSKKLYASEYSLVELQEWGRKIRNWDMKVFLYFDNDSDGFAVKNAKLLKEILAIP
jgi:uncharacterized protein YecE (DUF72 family)